MPKNQRFGPNFLSVVTLEVFSDNQRMIISGVIQEILTEHEASYNDDEIVMNGLLPEVLLLIFGTHHNMSREEAEKEFLRQVSLSEDENCNESL